MDPPPIAIVKVGLDSLEFWDGREVDQSIVRNLVEIFQKSPYGCDREHDLHVIKGHVDPNDLDQILELSNLTLEDLQTSLDSQGFRPRIETGNLRIRCLDGRHRVEAAKCFLRPSDLWWTVKLYFTLKEGKRHETRYSDGEIYLKVRYYQRAQQEGSVQEWMLCLSKSKQRDLSWLLERTEYTDRLDMLEIFPGLWIGFELGYIRRQFALRCDEELQRYLLHIYTIWVIITLDDPEIQRSTNIETVQRLQGKAPSVCIADRRSIIEDIGSGILFPNVRDAMTRQRVQEAILGLDVIIPSIKTLNENSKLLEIGVHIIRRELTDSRSGSLFDTLCGIWSPPSTCSLETHEGIFRPILLPNNINHAYLVYFMIFLAAFRQFPNLGDVPPRRDTRSVPLQAQADPAHRTLFARRARFLGYNNKRIQENCSLVNGELSVNVRHPATCRKSRDGMETRWGRPFGQAHAQLQENLFILNLSRARLEITQKPSAMFVQQNFLRAFFRPNVIFADWNRSLPLRFTATDLAANSHQLWNDFIHHRTVGRSVTGSLSVEQIYPTQERSNFDAPRESTISPTSTTISSIRSNLIRSPSITGTIYSSPRVQDLASQFMNTGIEMSTGVESTGVESTGVESTGVESIGVEMSIREQIAPNPQVIASGNVDAEVAPLIVSPPMHEESSEHVWEGQSDTTTILGSDRDSWVSEGSTIVASEGNEDKNLVSTKHRPHRSYLVPHQLRRSEPGGASSRSFLKASVKAQVRKERRLVRRRGRMGHRSLLTPAARVVRQISPRRRGRMRSFLALDQDKISPKGKGILRDWPGTSIQPNSSTEPPAPCNRGARAVRSYLGPGHNKQQSAGSVFQAGGRTVIQAKGTARAARSYLGPGHNKQQSAGSVFQAGGRTAIQAKGTARAVRSYLRLGQDGQGNQPINGTEALYNLPEPERTSAVEFAEYNGMTLLQRSTTNLTEYLRRRKVWISMVIIEGELRTLRLDHVARYIENKALVNETQTFFLAKQPHAERFRVNYPK